jgi:hypothetical protein
MCRRWLHSWLHTRCRTCRMTRRIPISERLSDARLRVPDVYPAHAFLAILAIAAECRMNNLGVCSGVDISTPPASTLLTYLKSISYGTIRVRVPFVSHENAPSACLIDKSLWLPYVVYRLTGNVTRRTVPTQPRP